MTLVSLARFVSRALRMFCAACIQAASKSTVRSSAKDAMDAAVRVRAERGAFECAKMGG